MAKKYLDENGLLYFWQKIKTLFVTDVTYDSTNRKVQKAKAGTTSDVVTLSKVATSGSYEDLSNKPTIPEGVAKSTTTPKMDGTASVGSETKFAAGDHVHPSDTSRVPTTRKINGKALSADIDVIEATGTVTSGGAILTTPAKYAAETAYDDYEIYDKNAVDGLFNSASDEMLGYFVKQTTTINGKGLSDDITLDADDVYAIPTSAKGAASGVCPLDANSKVASQYLPSYVDDVVEAYARSGQTALSQSWLATGSATGTVITPEAGKIYILMADSGDYAANTQFRWSGTTYVKMADGGVSSITNSEIDTIVAA
jgi:hypothetical protein